VTGTERMHPAFRLVVFRHGPSEEPDPSRWPDDDRRPLSEDGRTEVRRAAKGLVAVAGPFAHIASSPADRALATAEALRDAAHPSPRLEIWPELAPGRPAEPVLGRVARLARPGEVIAVVGHAPTLPELVGFAVVGDAVGVTHIARGGAACLEFASDVRPGGGVLAWLLTRRQLGGLRE
jgi:phosphohistidine phosphatase